ncbi:SLBB domain-containing protein [Niveibacterium terrae]|uniref:SLBB domain-containing protein n=1 Tax=Niveibacterium terrae TaxID=3373598 RepID=UPI003A91D151
MMKMRKLLGLACLGLCATAVMAQTLPDFNANPGDSSASMSVSSASVSAPNVIRSTNSRSASNTMKPQQAADLPLAREKRMPEAPTEFQKFVLQSTGAALPIFGRDLFSDVPSTFAPLENVPVSSDYVVGPGDEVMIRAWGQLEVDVRAVVDRNGAISIPKVGVINIAGISYQDLPAYIKNAIGHYYRNFEITVSLGQLRTIQIYVVGQAQRPGAFTISSQSSLVNAIFAAGGPSPKGTMRRVQLKRHDKLVSEFDLYDLLLRGDKSRDVKLLPGDVIFFPAVGPQVAISGSTNTRAVFELRGKDSLQDLINWAGGLATTAQGQQVTIDRIDARSSRHAETLPLDPAGLASALQDGDVVTVFALSPRFDKTVTLRGNVAYPRRQAWREGLRVADLIPNKEALTVPNYWSKRNEVKPLSKEATDPVKAFRLDAKAEDGKAARADLAEAPEDPAEPVEGDEVAAGGKLKNALKRQQGEVNWDYAVVERLQEDLSTTLIPFNLGRAVLDKDPQHNLPLQPGDVIVVFSKADIAVPVAKQTKYVRLEGEFKSAGIYRVQDGETLRQLIARVGGLTDNAYLFGSEFTRESTRKAQQKSMAEAVSRLEKNVQDQSVKLQQSALSAEDALATRQQIQAQQEYLKKLQSVAPTGRVVMALEPRDDLDVTKLPDVPLEDGDRLYVPSKPSTVNVFGSVYSPASYLFEKSKRVEDYLAMAGGVNASGDSGEVFVLRADGSVVSKKQSGVLFNRFGGNRAMPGDTVVVPEDLERSTTMKSLKDWTQILYQFGIGIAGVKALGGF